jgi:hypothetical protein
MKANELRIGNWYQSVKFQQPVQCDLSDLFDLCANSDGAYNDPPVDEMFESIPLTEEWLLKFGFGIVDHSGTHFFSKDIEIDNGNHPDLYLHFHIKNGEIVNSGMTSGEIDNEDGYEGERTHLVNIIEYVHQLQNLYFALTGKELTI